jgi:hypothetical protein
MSLAQREPRSEVTGGGVSGEVEGILPPCVDIDSCAHAPCQSNETFSAANFCIWPRLRPHPHRIVSHPQRDATSAAHTKPAASSAVTLMAAASSACRPSRSAPLIAFR